MAKKLLPYDPQGIILEATGGLEVPVITALDAVGLKVIRMNPKRVRDFANGMGFLAKTDALDVQVLAMFGARARPPYRAFPKKSAERMIAGYGKEIAQVEKQVAAWVAQSETWKEQEALLRSAPGVGPKTALVLLAQLPELGAKSIAGRLRRWPAWLPLPPTAAMTKANVTSEAAATGFAPLFTSPVGRPPSRGNC